MRPAPIHAERLATTATDTFQTDLQAQPIERTGYHTIEVEVLDDPPDHIATRLELEEDKKVFVRRRAPMHSKSASVLT